MAGIVSPACQGMKLFDLAMKVSRAPWALMRIVTIEKQEKSRALQVTRLAVRWLLHKSTP